MDTSQPDPRNPVEEGAVCPYCGGAPGAGNRCAQCRGLLDPLSRQASQNSMGPWFIRDEASPFRPGCSFETLCDLIRRGRVGPDSIVRGPTTRQFWMPARRVPSVANQFGVCHNCGSDVKPDDFACDECGAVFTGESDRQRLGLAAVRAIPGAAAPVAPGAAGPVRVDRVDPVLAPRPRPVLTPVRLIVGLLALGSLAAGWFAIENIGRTKERSARAPASSPLERPSETRPPPPESAPERAPDDPAPAEETPAVAVPGDAATDANSERTPDFPGGQPESLPLGELSSLEGLP